MKTKLFGFFLFILSFGIILLQASPAQSRSMEEICGETGQIAVTTMHYDGQGHYFSVTQCVAFNEYKPLGRQTAEKASAAPENFAQEGFISEDKPEGIVMDREDIIPIRKRIVLE